MNQIDLTRAIKAPFADKDWVTKTLLACVWTILGFTIPALYGAQVEYINRTSRGDESLPDWSDFGGKWVKGFLVWIASFLYFLPAVVMFGIGLIPVAVAAISSANSQGVGSLGALAAGSTCLFVAIATVYSFAVSLIFNAAVVNFAMKGTFGAFFEFGEIMVKVRGGSGYFTAWLFALVISIGASTVSGMLTATYVGAILVFPLAYLTMMMTGSVLGQWASGAYGINAPLYATAMGSPYSSPVPPAPPAPPTYPVPPAPPVPESPQYAPPAPAAPASPESVAPTTSPVETDAPSNASTTQESPTKDTTTQG